MTQRLGQSSYGPSGTTPTEAGGDGRPRLVWDLEEWHLLEEAGPGLERGLGTPLEKSGPE